MHTGKTIRIWACKMHSTLEFQIGETVAGETVSRMSTEGQFVIRFHNCSHSIVVFGLSPFCCYVAHMPADETVTSPAMCMKCI